MRAALLAAFLLLAPVAIAPPAAAMGGPCIDPCVVILVVELVVGCAASEANYIVHGAASCWGLVSSAECAAARIEQAAGVGEGCA